MLEIEIVNVINDLKGKQIDEAGVTQMMIRFPLKAILLQTVIKNSRLASRGRLTHVVTASKTGIELYAYCIICENLHSIRMT